MGMGQQKCYANAEAKIDEKVSHRLQLAVNEMRSAFLPICTPSFTSLLSLSLTPTLSLSRSICSWGVCNSSIWYCGRQPF